MKCLTKTVLTRLITSGLLDLPLSAEYTTWISLVLSLTKRGLAVDPDSRKRAMSPYENGLRPAGERTKAPVT